MQNILPTVHHHEPSPYLIYDRFTADVLKTPISQFKSIVIAHIPSGRIQLFNPKFLDDHPVKGILFESPIHIGVFVGEDVPLSSHTRTLLPT